MRVLQIFTCCMVVLVATEEVTGQDGVDIYLNGPVNILYCNAPATAEEEELCNACPNPQTGIESVTPPKEDSNTHAQTNECTEEEGIVWIADKPFMIFTRGGPNDFGKWGWYEARDKCAEQNMVMAEPKDLKAVHAYLWANYHGLTFWLGAQADDVDVFHWISNGQAVNTSDDLWSDPPTWMCHERVKFNDCCLASYGRYQPYQNKYCSNSYAVICQCK